MPSGPTVEPLVLRLRKRGRNSSLVPSGEESFPSGLVVHENDEVVGEPTRKRTRVFRKVRETEVNTMDWLQKSQPLCRPFDVRVSSMFILRNQPTSDDRRSDECIDTVLEPPSESSEFQFRSCYYIEEAPSYSGPELADAVDLSEWWAKIVASQDGSVGRLAAEGTSVKLSSELLLGRRAINLSASDGAEPREQDTLDLSPVLKAPTVGYVPASEVEGFEGIAEAFRAYSSHVTYQTEEEDDDWTEIERKYLS
ncbi:hypothetical protein FOZ61_009103 [Perkinsus olseni]|uniref:Uncharacterized protein n=1 Tax=Perkinsus olseni TaxID=32597 RepID=A0A7J6M602_PEROL|nr:hypothetical protein FOZ61_009103 [Perkinsus olseni]